MKKLSGSLLLFIGTCFLVLTGFRSTETTATAKSKPVPVNIEFVYTSVGGDGTFMGTFEANGGIDATGTSAMTVDRFANVAHCTQILEAPGGTITIDSYCQFSTMRGSWHIVDATGTYEGLKGNGRLLMMFPGGGIIVTESYEGRVH